MARVAALVIVVLLGACGGDDDGVVHGGADARATTTTVRTTTPDAVTTTTEAAPSPSRDPNQRYRVSALILEQGEHGPQLCLGPIAATYPPQCGGPDVAGWRWDDVADEESVNDTTWAHATVVGTYDGATFTLVERPSSPQPTAPGPQLDFSPACDAPDGDPDAPSESFRQPDDPDVAAVWVSDPAGEWEGPLVYSVIVRPGAADRVRALVRESWAGMLCVVERDQPSRAALEELQARVHAESADAPLGGIWASGVDERRGVVVITCSIADAVSQAWVDERWGPHVELDGLLEPV